MAAALAVVVAGSGVAFGGNFALRTYAADSTAASDQSGSFDYNSKKYTYNKDLYNVLFMGIDDGGVQQQNDVEGKAGDSDTLILFSMDKTTKDVKVMQISGEALTDVNVDVNHKVNEQIKHQYKSGDNKKTSALATKSKVNELLGGVPIDGFISLNMDGVAKITDEIGGVTMTMPRDCEAIDPSYKEGATVTLNGAEAETFVRYRAVGENDSNGHRMQRQLPFLKTIFTKFVEQNKADGTFGQSMLDKEADFLTTDLTADQMKTFADGNFKFDDTAFIPGESKDTKGQETFVINEDKLKDVIVSMFCKEA